MLGPRRGGGSRRTCQMLKLCCQDRMSETCGQIGQTTSTRFLLLCGGWSFLTTKDIRARRVMGMGGSVTWSVWRCKFGNQWFTNRWGVMNLGKLWE